MRAEWSSCPGSLERRARESVAPLRRSSTGWMSAINLKVVRWCTKQWIIKCFHDAIVVFRMEKFMVNKVAFVRFRG